MVSKVVSTLNWLPSYLWDRLKKNALGLVQDRRPKHLYFCICDHYEPYWNNADPATARRRIQRWLDEYPEIAEKYRDSDGNLLKYSFFYPEEEYREDDLNALAGLCHAGYGEVEIHLHHDNDTAENLRRTLLDYKRRLHEKHGLLSIDRETGEIAYGFIHGNWALDNSRPDGRWCGVNNEISVLLETGCYADFTMPSAPCPTQTRKINSIYYAVDNPCRPKSHNSGVNARVGERREGLLMVQGPLMLNWGSRKYGFFPGIENSGIYSNSRFGKDQVRAWIDAHVHVEGAEDHVFVKLYTHGTQEKIMDLLFNRGGLQSLLSRLVECCHEKGIRLHHVSAREMANRVLTLQEAGAEDREGGARYSLLKMATSACARGMT